jgi:hypothetical protein
VRVEDENPSRKSRPPEDRRHAIIGVITRTDNRRMYPKNGARRVSIFQAVTGARRREAPTAPAGVEAGVTSRGSLTRRRVEGQSRTTEDVPGNVRRMRDKGIEAYTSQNE